MGTFASELGPHVERLTYQPLAFTPTRTCPPGSSSTFVTDCDGMSCRSSKTTHYGGPATSSTTGYLARSGES